MLVYFPFNNSVMPLRVVRRDNRPHEEFLYGPLPVSFTGHDSGVIPAREATSEFTFNYTRLLPEEAPDMWFFTDNNKVYHVHTYIEPSHLLRVFLRIPYGTTPWRFRTVSVAARWNEIEFGFFRGHVETVFLPHLKVGWVVSNPTNVDLRTNTKFVYGEYTVEPVLEPEVIWEAMSKRMPHHLVAYGGTAPIDERDMSLMLKALGAVTVPVQPRYLPRTEALSRIQEAISRLQGFLRR